jgi:hypothetical protein
MDVLDEVEVDALLQGDELPGRDLALVTGVVRSLRAAARREPVPPLGPTLRAQLYGGRVMPLPARRAALRSLWVAVASVLLAMLLAVGAVQAADNRLPTSLQDPVSATAGLVGLDVPRSEDRHSPAPSGSATPASTPAPGSASAVPLGQGVAKAAGTGEIERPEATIGSVPTPTPPSGSRSNAQEESLEQREAGQGEPVADSGMDGEVESGGTMAPAAADDEPHDDAAGQGETSSGARPSSGPGDARRAR